MLNFMSWSKKTTPEGREVKAVAEFLQLQERLGKGNWYRVRNMSFNANRQQFIKPQGALFKNGIPDINGTYMGISWALEIKAPTTYKTSLKTGRRVIDKRGGEQSADQKEFQRRHEANGGIYLVIDGGVEQVRREVFEKSAEELWGIINSRICSAS